MSRANNFTCEGVTCASRTDFALFLIRSAFHAGAALQQMGVGFWSWALVEGFLEHTFWLRRRLGLRRETFTKLKNMWR
jgi:hypothetical protein